MELPVNFFESVEKTESCWNWVGMKDHGGYGKKKIKGKGWFVHRLMYMSLHGEIEKGLVIMHTCDNRACVNPDHLRKGTQKQNVHDMISKNRANRCHKEKNGRSKLTVAQVEEIRRMYVKGNNVKNEFSSYGLSRKFGVSPSQINAVVNKKFWKQEE